MSASWPKALIFNLDGAVAVTGHGRLRAMNRAFEECGLEWRWDRSTLCELSSAPDDVQRMRQYATRHPLPAMAKRDSDALFQSLKRREKAIYAELLRGGEIRLRVGVIRLLREARLADMVLAIVTTMGLGEMRRFLRSTLGVQAWAWFEVIETANAEKGKWPTTEAYKRVLSRLGLVADQCLAFEDSVMGLRAAVGADLRTVITAGGFGDEQRFDEAVLVVDGLGDPGRPARVSRGRLGGARIVDLAALRLLRQGRVRVRITYLQMSRPPTQAPLDKPAAEICVLRAQQPTLSFYRYLYETVGGPWLWDLRRKMADGLLRGIIGNPRVFIHVLYRQGVPLGFVELDARHLGEVEIAYFGLIPDAIGQGLGRYLLDWAVRAAWRLSPARVWLHTCSLDHPRALATYQNAGFTVYERETLIVPDPRHSPTLADVKQFHSRVESVP